MVWKSDDGGLGSELGRSERIHHRFELFAGCLKDNDVGFDGQ